MIGGDVARHHRPGRRHLPPVLTAGALLVSAVVLVPLVFLVGASLGLGAIVYGSVKNGDWSPVTGLGISLLGFPVYYWWKKPRVESAPAPASPP